MFVKEVLMKTGDIVLFAKNGRVCVGRVGPKWADKRWTIKPFIPGEQCVKRHSKFLTPIENVKKYLDISKKI